MEVFVSSYFVFLFCHVMLLSLRSLFFSSKRQEGNEFGGEWIGKELRVMEGWKTLIRI